MEHAMASLKEIRSTFLDFFGREGHEILPSSALVPRNDPTLLFTNAGMVQFKNVFTGQEKRPAARAATAQKCLRAGGKHNDLDRVGYTARHHTFFEMLGNFSFGDYFKDEAIKFAWDLSTKDFGLSKDRLLVTVYSEDEDAHRLWKKIAGLADSRIVRIGTSDNFWSMGETGPCGPCSEIFYDHGEHVPGGPPGSDGEDGDRFVEIWNLVFMQYDQERNGERKDLPKPSIDTGMGLERMAAVTQGVHDNYDIDLFRHLISASEEESKTRADGANAVSHRVIADHLRASAFLIADGVLPSNEGRGYVLRRIMRRGMRHAHILGAKDPLLHRLVPVLIAEMGEAYPELKRAEALVSETLRLEESRFRDTLARGIKLLDEATAKMGKGDTLRGDVAFKLYDTYGFPVDLTEDALRARGIDVDRKGFDTAMARQKAEARKAWAGSGEVATDGEWFSIREEFGATEFLGYESENGEGVVTAILRDGKRVASAAPNQELRVLTNQTPFYGESGGQIGDRGAIFSAQGAQGEVIDTEKKLGALHVHVVKLSRGEIRVGDVVELRVDAERRRLTRANHSATHLLHKALKNVLGAHVAQKGSYVGPDRLRFDFSHLKAMSSDELGAVEDEVNAVLARNTDVTTRLMPTDEAIKAGAVAMFGEKYGEEVRVLSMGEDIHGSAEPYSVELCGGTHVRRLGDIGLFTIFSEGASAAGIRRIEAFTSDGARRYLESQAKMARQAAAVLKTSPAELSARVAQLFDEKRKLERELSEAKKSLALAGPSQSANDENREIGGIPCLLRVLTDVPAKELKALADEAKAKLGSGVVAFVTASDGKASLVVGVTDDLTSRLSAVDLVREGAAALGGKGGGGRADMAQAGGPDGARAADALAAIEKRLSALGG